MTAAARAAAKRARRVEHLAAEAPSRAEERYSGRTVVIDAPGDDGWDDPPEPASESEEAPEESASVRRSWRRLLTLVSSVLLVAGLVAVAVLGWQYREGRRAEQTRGEALAAARKAAPVVLSYDYRHLDRDFARARTHLTGSFRSEYGRTTTKVVGPTARKYHGVVKATVAAPSGGGLPAASVVSAGTDKAVVLLFVNQVTTSTQVTGSRVDLNRVRMTLTRTSEGWKVSAVDAL
jgi:Mce-associated membrane protein